MSNPKSHHYVPKAYLRRFAAADGFLCVLDRKRGQLRRQKPDEVMIINRYYRQAWAPSGIDPDVLEKGFSAIAESQITSTLNRLCDDTANLTADEGANLVTYMELQRIRVPRQAAWGTELMRQLILKMISSDLRQELREKKLRLTMKDSARFDYMRATLGTIHPWLTRMEWEVYQAEAGASFVTTDSPVAFMNQSVFPPAEPGLGLAGTLVLFPLSSRNLLVMRHPECNSAGSLQVLPDPTEEDTTGVKLGFGQVMESEKVRNTNWYLVALSDHLCVAESEAPLREAVTI
jgi:Protein of unknown function (DUF4238)